MLFLDLRNGLLEVSDFVMRSDELVSHRFWLFLALFSLQLRVRKVPRGVLRPSRVQQHPFRGVFQDFFLFLEN